MKQVINSSFISFFIFYVFIGQKSSNKNFFGSSIFSFFFIMLLSHKFFFALFCFLFFEDHRFENILLSYMLPIHSVLRGYLKNCKTYQKNLCRMKDYVSKVQY